MSKGQNKISDKMNFYIGLKYADEKNSFF